MRGRQKQGSETCATRRPRRLRTAKQVTGERMTLRAKIFLFLSVLSYAISFTRFGAETLYDIPKPLGAIFFGLFLITWIFPRHIFDQLDEDQALRNQLIKKERQERRRQRRVRFRVRWKPRPVHS